MYDVRRGGCMEMYSDKKDDAESAAEAKHLKETKKHIFGRYLAAL